MTMLGVTSSLCFFNRGIYFYLDGLSPDIVSRINRFIGEARSTLMSGERLCYTVVSNSSTFYLRSVSFALEQSSLLLSANEGRSLEAGLEQIEL